MSDLRTQDELRALRRQVEELRAAISRLPVERGKIRTSTGNVILATVNEPTGVTGADATFSFDNAIAIVGSAPANGTGTAQNTYAQVYSDNDEVLLFQRKDNNEWETERGGTAGSLIYRCETTAAKGWDDGTVAGVLLDATDTPTGGAITLTDRAPAKHQCHDGSRGYCLKDGESTYWIITMDSPARWIEGTLDAEWPIGDPSAMVEVTDFWGASPNHMEPEYESTTVVEVFDTANIRNRTIAEGEIVRALWDEKREKWLLEAAPPLYIRVQGTSPSVYNTDTEFTLSTFTVINGADITGPLTVKCVVPMNAPSGRTVFAQFNSSAGSTVEEMWDNGDGGNFPFHLRGLTDGYAPEMIVESGADDATDPHWAQTGECDEEEP